jgi:hypothetical protein
MLAHIYFPLYKVTASIMFMYFFLTAKKVGGVASTFVDELWGYVEVRTSMYTHQLDNMCV